MLDVETFGLDTALHGVSSLAMVPFGITPELDKIIDYDNILHARLDVSTMYECYHSTQEFRDKHEIDLREAGLPQMTPEEIKYWLEEYYDDELKNTLIWAKPTAFDIPMLQKHFRDDNVSWPFSHRSARDVYTYIDTNGMDVKEVQTHCDLAGKHDAKIDCIIQIRMLVFTTWGVLMPTKNAGPESPAS
jgi:hypothetical protein